MRTTQIGVSCVFICVCICSLKTEGLIVLKNRTCVALAPETVLFNIEVTVPMNSSSSSLTCYLNNQERYKHPIEASPPLSSLTRTIHVKITVNSSLDSGEYHCTYNSESVFGVILVRDVGYTPEEGLQLFVIILLAVSGLELLFGICGSAYIIMWHKDYPKSETNEEKGKKKPKRRSTSVTETEVNSDSIYTVLGPRDASVYGVLNVDEVSRANGEKKKSKDNSKVTIPAVDEGVFESVYENY